MGPRAVLAMTGTGLPKLVVPFLNWAVPVALSRCHVCGGDHETDQSQRQRHLDHVEDGRRGRHRYRCRCWGWWDGCRGWRHRSWGWRRGYRSWGRRWRRRSGWGDRDHERSVRDGDGGAGSVGGEVPSPSPATTIRAAKPQEVIQPVALARTSEAPTPPPPLPPWHPGRPHRTPSQIKTSKHRDAPVWHGLLLCKRRR